MAVTCLNSMFFTKRQFFTTQEKYNLFSLSLHTNLITRSLLNNVRKIYRSIYRPVSNTGKHTSNKKNMEIWTIVHFPNPFPSPDFHHQTFTTYQVWKIMTISQYFYTAAMSFSIYQSQHSLYINLHCSLPVTVNLLVTTVLLIFLTRSFMNHVHAFGSLLFPSPTLF